jgi:hypothetical protein
MLNVYNCTYWQLTYYCWPTLTKDRPTISSERAPSRTKNRNCQTVTNIWSWAPDGARHQDRQTDRPSVAMWLRLRPQFQFQMRRIELIVETVSDWEFAYETERTVKLQETEDLHILAFGRLYFILYWLSATVIVRLKELQLFVVPTYPINQSNKCRNH